jgi:hypothetical protein
MSLRDSFHCSDIQPATHLLRPGPTATTSSTALHHAPASRCQHPMAPISTKILCHLKWSLRAHYPHESFTPSAFLSQPYMFHHHLHRITAVVIICHLCLCCLCNHHDPPLPFPLSLDMAPSTAVNAVDPTILENAAFYI